MSKPEIETQLWWASVGGGSCEPIRVRIEGGAPAGFWSIGCTDEHSLDGVELVKQIEPTDLPLNARQAKALEAKWTRSHAREAWKGYRKF